MDFELLKCWSLTNITLYLRLVITTFEDVIVSMYSFPNAWRYPRKHLTTLAVNITNSQNELHAIGTGKQKIPPHKAVKYLKLQHENKNIAKILEI